MAKFSRNDLKSLVKECLFEILLESTEGATDSSTITESRGLSRKPKARKSRDRSSTRPALDSISYSSRKTGPAPIDTSSITSDPVMAAIFQDTAKTTLQEQAAAERGKMISGGDTATQIAREADPAELFGESSQNWAALAFSETQKS